MAIVHIKTFFTYFPYAVLALTLVTFVWRARMSWWARLAWAFWLLACCSKFYCFARWGGHVYEPVLPVWVMWMWNWAYSGAIILALLALLTVWWRSRVRVWVLPVVAWTVSTVGLWNGVRPPSVHEVELVYSDLPAELDGYRIVQLSDLHASSSLRRWRTQAVVDLVNGLDADLICLTGDYADGWAGLIGPCLEPIRNLRARDGVWAVTGNHEFYCNRRDWTPLYEAWGIRFLVNACAFPRPSLALGGVNDIQVLADEPYPNVARAFAAATNGEFRVLLQHRPAQAHANIEGHGVRLQLSGHTHGGIMPVLSELVRQHNGGYVRGLYEFPHGRLYVSPGSGQWAGFPMRFFNDSEITLLTLRRRK